MSDQRSVCERERGIASGEGFELSREGEKRSRSDIDGEARKNLRHEPWVEHRKLLQSRAAYSEQAWSARPLEILLSGEVGADVANVISKACKQGKNYLVFEGEVPDSEELKELRLWRHIRATATAEV